VSVVGVVLVKGNGHGENHRQKGEQNQGELHLGNGNERLRIVRLPQREKLNPFISYMWYAGTRWVSRKLIDGLAKLKHVTLFFLAA